MYPPLPSRSYKAVQRTTQQLSCKYGTKMAFCCSFPYVSRLLGADLFQPGHFPSRGTLAQTPCHNAPSRRLESSKRGTEALKISRNQTLLSALLCLCFRPNSARFLIYPPTPLGPTPWLDGFLVNQMASEKRICMGNPSNRLTSTKQRVRSAQLRPTWSKSFFGTHHHHHHALPQTIRPRRRPPTQHAEHAVAVA